MLPLRIHSVSADPHTAMIKAKDPSLVPNYGTSKKTGESRWLAPLHLCGAADAHALPLYLQA